MMSAPSDMDTLNEDLIHSVVSSGDFKQRDSPTSNNSGLMTRFRQRPQSKIHSFVEATDEDEEPISDFNSNNKRPHELCDTSDTDLGLDLASQFSYYQSPAHDEQPYMSELNEELLPVYDASENPSSLSCKEFNVSFLFICSKLNLPPPERNTLLQYIKKILPQQNRVPTSYTQITTRSYSKKMEQMKQQQQQQQQQQQSSYQPCNLSVASSSSHKATIANITAAKKLLGPKPKYLSNPVLKNLTVPSVASPSSPSPLVRTRSPNGTQAPLTNNQIENKMTFKNVDLIKIAATTVTGYGVRVARILWTDDELENSRIVDEGAPSRDAQSSRKAFDTKIDREKIDILQNACMIRFNLTGDKWDKAWSSVKKSVNNRGRNAKHEKKVRSSMQMNMNNPNSNHLISNLQNNNMTNKNNLSNNHNDSSDINACNQDEYSAISTENFSFSDFNEIPSNENTIEDGDDDASIEDDLDDDIDETKHFLVKNETE